MKTFTLTFTEQELNTIGAALEQAPFKMVAPLINSINQQLAKLKEEVS